MRKPHQSRTGSYVFLAVVSALVAFLTVGVFTPGYVPSCDHHPMRQGDTCIGSGGGSYDQMVNAHYRNDEIGFVISFPLAILFTALSMSEVRRNRRAKRPPRPRPPTVKQPARIGAPVRPTPTRRARWRPQHPRPRP